MNETDDDGNGPRPSPDPDPDPADTPPRPDLDHHDSPPLPDRTPAHPHRSPVITTPVTDDPTATLMDLSVLVNLSLPTPRTNRNDT